MIWETMMTKRARRIVDSNARSALRLSCVPQSGVGLPSCDTNMAEIAARSPIASRTERISCNIAQQNSAYDSYAATRSFLPMSKIVICGTGDASSWFRGVYKLKWEVSEREYTGNARPKGDMGSG